MKSPLQKATLLLPQRLAQQGADLTASELTVAQTLGSNYPHALLESATALAAHTGTSASTVDRFRGGSVLSTRPDGSTTPARIFVPPRSTPITRCALNPAGYPTSPDAAG